MSEMSDDFKEIIDNFLVETDELIEKLGNDFIQLEADSEDTEIIHDIFRTVHSIKGTAGFLGFYNMQRVSHGMEDILNKLRHEEIKLTENITDVLYAGLDSLQVIVADVKEGDAEKSKTALPMSSNEYSMVTSVLETWFNGLFQLRIWALG